MAQLFQVTGGLVIALQFDGGIGQQGELGVGLAAVLAFKDLQHPGIVPVGVAGLGQQGTHGRGACGLGDGFQPGQGFAPIV